MDSLIVLVMVGKIGIKNNFEIKKVEEGGYWGTEWYLKFVDKVSYNNHRVYNRKSSFGEQTCVRKRLGTRHNR